MPFQQEPQDPANLPASESLGCMGPASKVSSVLSEPAATLGLGAVALAVRLYGLGDKSFWFDELRTWARARLPFAQLVADSLIHKHFPTYFLLVRPFASTDNPEWMLRLPSALLGTLCVLFVARLGYDVRGKLSGIAAGLLMALSPIEVRYAQEARPYALISCLVLVALWGLVRIAQNPERAALPVTQRAALRGAWTAYTLGTLGALLVENNTVPCLVFSNLAFLLVVFRAASGRRALVRNWACSQALIMLCWLPAITFMLWANRNSPISALGWIPRANWQSIRSTIGALYLFRISGPDMKLMASPIPGFGVAIGLFALFGAWRLKAKPELLAVLGLAFLAMPITVLAASAVQPLLVPRYLLWSTGPFFVLAGIGAAVLPATLRLFAALFVLLGGAARLAPYYGAEIKPPWRQAAAYLANNARPRDVVVVQNASDEFVLATYLEIQGVRRKFPILIGESDSAVMRLTAEGERVWLLLHKGPQGAAKRVAPDIVGPGGYAEQIDFGSSILIVRVDGSS